MKSRRLTNNDDDKISEPCFFRVSPNQMYVIEGRFRQSGTKSFSAFLRQQVVCGLQLQFDNEEYMLIQRAIQKSAVNLNQIESFVINSGMFNINTMNVLKDMMDEIWQIQRDMQCSLTQHLKTDFHHQHIF